MATRPCTLRLAQLLRLPRRLRLVRCLLVPVRLVTYCITRRIILVLKVRCPRRRRRPLLRYGRCFDRLKWRRRFLTRSYLHVLYLGLTRRRGIICPLTRRSRSDRCLLAGLLRLSAKLSLLKSTAPLCSLRTFKLLKADRNSLSSNWNSKPNSVLSLIVEFTYPSDPVPRSNNL